MPGRRAAPSATPRSAIRLASSRRPRSISNAITRACPISIQPRIRLTVHGMVDRPLVFSIDELKRLPSVSRFFFIECSGNTSSEWGGANAPDVQRSHGLTSCSEWTGVWLSTILRQSGAQAARDLDRRGRRGRRARRAQPADGQGDEGRARRLRAERRAASPRAGLSAPADRAGHGRHRQREVAASRQARRSAGDDAMGDIEVHGSPARWHIAHLHIRDGREVGDHASVWRRDAAGRRRVRNFRACLDRPRRGRARGHHH